MVGLDFCRLCPEGYADLGQVATDVLGSLNVIVRSVEVQGLAELAVDPVCGVHVVQGTAGTGIVLCRGARSLVETEVRH